MSNLSVSIEGEKFEFWKSLSHSHGIDSIDTLDLGSVNDPDNPFFKSTFLPFKYRTMEIALDNNPLFTGLLVNPLPSTSPEAFLMTLSGFGSPGILQNSTMPQTSWPLQFNKLNLRDISTAVCEAFNIGVKFDADPGPVFEKVAFKPTAKALPFLVGLGQQRGVVYSGTPDGDLWVRTSEDTGNPVAKLKQGQSPLLDVKPLFKPQEYYSEITGIKPIKRKSKKSISFTLKNPFLSNVVLPFTFDAKDVGDGDLEAAVNAKMGRMFANAISYRIDLATWFDPNGKLFEANTFVEIEYPAAGIFKPYTFLIRTVDREKRANLERCSLNVVLPGSFSGTLPESLPWD